ncbi:MAG: aminotransferase class I/II-fold pyridoxal phosphate-dependent enzyme [Armatimonadetes bacterium]|nr:aminotransferase class I/II-fold pyridoxal phosphate-dependent enzyme [Armatimonadota bacterium]
MNNSYVSARTEGFTESVIREMTRRIKLVDGVNLAQGFPDFNPPEDVIEAAIDAIRRGINQYSITWGSPRLRRAICEKLSWYNGIEADPDKNVTVTCGATEAMMSALLAIINPGDEVIIFEPFYENYGPDTIISGAKPVYVPLIEPDFHFDPDALSAAFSDKTKAIVINTPHNPTGKVFTREEIEFIAELCAKHDALIVTDEIYEHILYNGAVHVSPASVPGLEARTITISGISKTYSATGWRVGWTIAPEHITGAIRKVHDFLTVGAPAPLQEAAAAAMRLPRDYYSKLAKFYNHKRDLILRELTDVGFVPFNPKGAYYVLTDISAFGAGDDIEFASYLVNEIGVATVPGSSFYSTRELGRNKIRFAFCKTEETLCKAVERLEKLKQREIADCGLQNAD